jgi:hypothetical protein
MTRGEQRAADSDHLPMAVLKLFTAAMILALFQQKRAKDNANGISGFLYKLILMWLI